MSPASLATAPLVAPRKSAYQMCAEGTTRKLSIEFNGSAHPVPIPLGIHSCSSSHLIISNVQLVGKLAGAGTFREFKRAFEGSTGMPLMLRTVISSQLAHLGNHHQNPFCALMHQTSESRTAGWQLQQRACDQVKDKSCTLKYSFGITETSVGVRIGQEIVAYLLTGQVFFNAPTLKQTRSAFKQIKEWKLATSLDNAVRLYHQTPIVRRMVYQASVRLLQIFASQLGAGANQIVLQQQTAESLQVTRARHFIEEHYSEGLSLTSVAKQAGMSTYYFCKQFKLATGLHFTTYVSRVRVEKAKNLLLNPNYRVSEIAFEVGFQSLTHFNRIFKTISGYSPTGYRRHLPVV